MSFSPKSPIERDYFGTDWTDELETGETIASAEVVVTIKRGKARDSNPAAMVSGAAAISGAVVSQLLIGGVPGVDYETSWKIVTSTPRTLEEKVPLLVR